MISYAKTNSDHATASNVVVSVANESLVAIDVQAIDRDQPADDVQAIDRNQPAWSNQSEESESRPAKTGL
jgi:hypothetical protein